MFSRLARWCIPDGALHWDRLDRLTNGLLPWWVKFSGGIWDGQGRVVPSCSRIVVPVATLEGGNIVNQTYRFTDDRDGVTLHAYLAD